MKKLFVLLGILCAFYFVSCGNIQLAGGDMGVVSLAIGDELAREIRSAASLRNATGGSYTLTASIRGEYSDSQTVAVANGNYSGVTFTFEGIPVGKKIILDLTAKAGSNYIWYGNSGKHTVERGENLLTIALGRVSGVLMWDSSSVKIAPYGNYDFDNATGTGFTLITKQDPSPIWCFDEQRNVYWFAVGENGTIRSNISDNGSYSASGISYSGGNIVALAYYNNNLYGIKTDGLYRLDNTTVSSRIVEQNITNCVGLAVYGNYAYIADFSQTEIDVGGIMSKVSKIIVKKYDMNNPDSSPLKKEIELPKNFVSDTFLAPTGQMIYHEGALYLLLSAFNITSNSNDSAQHSCGAIVKINPQTLAVDTSFGNGGFLGLADGRDVSGQHNGQDYNQTLYAPTESNVGRTFCGPAGFVAVMPKKLVIGDGGYTLSNSGTGLLAKRKSRIITVDLETLAFDIVNIDSSDLYGNLGTTSDFITPISD